MKKASDALCGSKHRVGNMRLDAVSREDLLNLYDAAIASRRNTLILHQNLHGIYIERKNPRSSVIYARADWVYVDGMPLIWIGQAAGLPLKAKHRVTLLDCFDEVLDHAAQRGWRLFYLGGTQEVLDTGLAEIRAQRPSLQLSGRNGYFTQAQNEDILREIQAFNPDVLFVGLGMPIQEHWILDHFDALQQIPVVTTSGATLEYVSGHSRRPAAWAGRFGLQGVMRLLAQPRRLWKRYLFEPLVLLPYLVRSVLQQRRKLKLGSLHG